MDNLLLSQVTTQRNARIHIVLLLDVAEAHLAALGKRPLDCWRDVAAVLDLSLSAQELVDQTEPLLQERYW